MSLLIHSIHQFECFINLPITLNSILQFMTNHSSVSVHLQDQGEIVILTIYTQSRWTNQQNIRWSLTCTEWLNMPCAGLHVFTWQSFKCPHKVTEIQAITRCNLYLNLFPKDKEMGTTFNIISSLRVQLFEFCASFIFIMLTHKTK